MSRRMFRYEVPVDDQPHGFDLLSNAPIRHVANRDDLAVEFWVEDYGDRVTTTRRAFRVFGTGQPLPDGARWVGTCDRSHRGLVWHLYEVAP